MARPHGEISERKWAEKAREDALTYAESIVDTVREPLVVLDGQLRVVSANKSFYRTFQVRPDETVSQRLYDLGSRQWGIPRLRELLEKILPENRAFDDFEVDWNFPTIGHKTMLLNARALRREGDQEEMILLAIEDITERKRSEEALAQYRQELARSNRELEDFTYVVSHDLKEPLRGIEAFSTFLADEYGDKLDEQGQKYVGVLRDSAMRMNALIEDLLKLSRVGRTRQAYVTVAVEPLLEDIRQDLAFALEEKKADLRIQPDLPAITCQPAHLKQVFQNLISNAIKFNDKPHPVIEIACHEADGAYTFSVRDNGFGIDERYHDKIFQVFQRLGRREDYEGTGAGLTICKKIVEAHGGRIWVESKVGEGSVFSFTIPKSIRPGQERKEEGNEQLTASDSGSPRRGQPQRRRDRAQGAGEIIRQD
jgi:PAS domain S-box-containing protein